MPHTSNAMITAPPQSTVFVSLDRRSRELASIRRLRHCRLVQHLQHRHPSSASIRANPFHSTCSASSTHSLTSRTSASSDPATHLHQVPCCQPPARVFRVFSILRILCILRILRIPRILCNLRGFRRLLQPSTVAHGLPRLPTRSAHPSPSTASCTFHAPPGPGTVFYGLP